MGLPATLLRGLSYTEKRGEVSDVSRECTRKAEVCSVSLLEGTSSSLPPLRRTTRIDVRRRLHAKAQRPFRTT